MPPAPQTNKKSPPHGAGDTERGLARLIHTRSGLLRILYQASGLIASGKEDFFMPIQTEQYRDQLDRLSARFPDREAISITEASGVLGVDRRSLLKNKSFPAKRPGGRSNGKIIVPIVSLAHWMINRG